MRFGEIYNAENLEKHLLRQVSAIRKLKSQGFKQIIAYPEKTKPSDLFPDGFKIRYFGVVLLFSAVVEYKSLWNKNAAEMNVCIGKNLEFPNGYPAPTELASSHPQQCIGVATDGVYIFVKTRIQGKSRWHRLGKSISVRELR